MREFIGGKISIDGRKLPFEIVTAYDYAIAKRWIKDEADFENTYEENSGKYELITDILALKSSHFLLRRCSHSCGSLPDSIYYIMNVKCIELNQKYGEEFDFDMIYGSNPISI